MITGAAFVILILVAIMLFYSFRPPPPQSASAWESMQHGDKTGREQQNKVYSGDTTEQIEHTDTKGMD